MSTGGGPSRGLSPGIRPGRARRGSRFTAMPSQARRIVAFNNVSADGYFAAPNGSLDWVVQDPKMDEFVGKAVERGGTDTFLFGRKTYQMFASFWPHVLDDSGTAPDPHHPEHVSKDLRAMAEMLNATPKIVFSKSLQEATWANSRILRTFDPKEIARMKAERGQDMMIFGSGSITTELTRHGLIDEYLFAVSPILLGSGRNLVSGVPANLKLELREEKRFPSGKVLLQYAAIVAPPARESAPEAPAAREKARAKVPAKKTAEALRQPDRALAKVVGDQPLPRHQVTKKIWAYIKRKGLQDKQNRRMVNADDALRPVFGKAQVNMLEVPELVDKHLKPAR